MRLTRIWALCSLFVLPIAAEARTTLRHDPLDPNTGPYPSDRLTVVDASQKTGRSVNLPAAPACGADVVSCAVVNELLNQFDGFSVKPQFTLCFSADINPATLKGGVAVAPADGSAPAMSINQVLYDHSSHCAVAKPDNVLNQSTRYLLFVSSAVRDATGVAVAADDGFKACVAGGGTSYCAALARALTSGPREARAVSVIGASLFTTMSATDWLQKARQFLYSGAAPPTRLSAGPKTVFNVADLQAFDWMPQFVVNVEPFEPLISIPPDALAGVDKVAFGLFRSPNFLRPSGPDFPETIGTIPTTKTGQKIADPLDFATISYHVFLPHVTDPSAKIPVVIYGHGSGDGQFGAPTAIASTLAKAGFATLAMDIVGYGFGPDSQTVLTDSSGTYTVKSPGRSLVVPGGFFVPGAGCQAFGPIAVRDCLRQSAVDVMALVQNIKADRLGLNLDPKHIYFVGQSLGSFMGTLVHAVDPDIKAAVINVGGDSVVDAARLAYGDNTDVEYLGAYSPQLLQGVLESDPAATLPDFDFYYAYRGPVKETATSSVVDIQRAFEVADWMNIPGAALAFAPHLKVQPLTKVPLKPTLFQFGWGDLEVANPVESNLVRAFAGQAQPPFATLPVQYFRFDRALALDPHLAYVFGPGAPFSILPHRYLANTSIGEPSNADALLLMQEVQRQVVRFFKFGTTGVLPPFFQNLSLATLPNMRFYDWPIQVNPAP